MKRKFKIWNADGKPQTVEASTVVWSKEKAGLKIRFDKQKPITGIVCMIEISEPQVIEESPKWEDEGD